MRCNLCIFLETHYFRCHLSHSAHRASSRFKFREGEDTIEQGKQPAKTDRTGFLDLPNEIRNRIYEDAVFNEERGSIYYPRKLPRKVTADGERITGKAHLGDYILNTVFPMSLSPSVSYDDCQWEHGQRPPEEIPLPIYTEGLTDDESESDEQVAIVSERYQTTIDSILLMQWGRDHRGFMRTRDAAAGNEAVLNDADFCEDCEALGCGCNESVASSIEVGSDESDSESDEDSRSEGGDKPRGVDEDGFLIQPKNCLKGKHLYVRDDCRFCAGFGLGPDQDETMYVDDEHNDKWYMDYDILEEDDEHYDSEERQGMLFRPREPGILLACKEIREQCLPIYYGSNAFSWRFFWLHQTSSLARFTEWTRVLGEHAKHITQISFEGRHSVEEGIEFEVDIDLLEETPHFDVEVECLHPGDELTDAIVEAVEQDFITVLWRMSRRDGGAIALSSDDMCLLGTVFSEAMQRDPGQAANLGQWDGKPGGAPRQYS